MYLPRTEAGTISETIACATGASPPTPTPIRNRQAIRTGRLQAVAAARLARPQTTMVTWNTALRPNRSEAVPAAMLPTSWPAKVMAASWPASVGLKPKATTIEPSRKVRSATSIWSTSHAEAMIAKIFRW